MLKFSKEGREMEIYLVFCIFINRMFKFWVAFELFGFDLYNLDLRRKEYKK